MHTECGKYLRSSSEIFFYYMLKNTKILFTIEERYKDSNMMCDFYFPEYDCYVEICGTKHSTLYDERMKRKQELFGCILLREQSKYGDFLDDLINGRKLKSEY